MHQVRNVYTFIATLVLTFTCFFLCIYTKCFVTCDSGDEDDDEWEDTDEEVEFDSEGEFSGEEAAENDGGSREFLFMDEETKSRFTEYSLTSSVMRRNEQLSLLDDRFEKVNFCYALVSQHFCLCSFLSFSVVSVL